MAEVQLAAIIMAGGVGTRFWPLSTPHEPKQFLRISGERTMLQQTWRRLDGLVPPERRLIVTGAEFVERSAEGLTGVDPENIIGEPEQRDTAAAAILGAALAARRWPEAVVLTLPADHLIEPTANFVALARRAAELAAGRGVLCTIGIPPLYPADSYGYIERGHRLEISGDGLRAFHVERFTEKPGPALAAEYLRQGTFCWNAGIFIWRSRDLLDEAQRFLPDHARLLTELAAHWRQEDFSRQMLQRYRQLQRVSIDVGIMERTRRAAVVEATFQWSDMGGWPALGERLAAIGGGGVGNGTGGNGGGGGGENRAFGQVAMDGCCNVIGYNSSDAPPMVCIGVDNLVVVHTRHGTLVCHKDRVERIKAAVNGLYESAGSNIPATHPATHPIARPARLNKRKSARMGGARRGGV